MLERINPYWDSLQEKVHEIGTRHNFSMLNVFMSVFVRITIFVSDDIEIKFGLGRCVSILSKRATHSIHICFLCIMHVSIFQCFPYLFRADKWT